MRGPYEPDIGPPPVIINITYVALRRALPPHLLSYQLGAQSEHLQRGNCAPDGILNDIG